jgi:hypothetical protein
VRADLDGGTEPFAAHLQTVVQANQDNQPLQEALSTVQSLLRQEAHHSAKDHVLELDLKALIADLSNPSLSRRTPARMGLLQDRFMALQQGKPDPRKTRKLDLEQAHAQLARFMLKTAPEQYAKLTQLQTEAEHQASRLKAVAAKYPPA